MSWVTSERLAKLDKEDLAQYYSTSLQSLPAHTGLTQILLQHPTQPNLLHIGDIMV